MAIDQRGRRPRAGAVSLGGGEAPPRKKGLAWLWILLALAIAAALVLFLLFRNAWDEGDSGGLDLSNDPSPSGEASAEGGGGADVTSTTGAGPARGNGNAATEAPLTADGRALLPLPAGGLAAFNARPVEAKSVLVESVVSDEGFWVGDNAEQRIFIRLRTGGAESPVEIEPGRPVSFTGVVTTNPPDVSTLGLSPEEGADQLTAQGHHIEVPLSDIQQG